jgi:hypothetical protein
MALQHFLLANGLLLAVSQDNMYNLALETASAGEQNQQQEQVLAKIVPVLYDHSIRLSILRGLKAYSNLYAQAKQARRHIRRHRLNR